jgi:hypothetical protein
VRTIWLILELKKEADKGLPQEHCPEVEGHSEPMWLHMERGKSSSPWSLILLQENLT